MEKLDLNLMTFVVVLILFKKILRLTNIVNLNIFTLKWFFFYIWSKKLIVLFLANDIFSVKLDFKIITKKSIDDK